MRVMACLLAAVLVAGCGGSPETSEPGAPTVRLLFAGDVMLGRRVGPVAEAEGPELLEGIRHVVSSADLAAANLESPLTTRAHVSDNPNILEADPAAAQIIAGAGFDLMSVANNHALDAGPEGLADTVAALASAGVTAIGGDAVDLEVSGIRLAFLAVEAARHSPDVTRTRVEAARQSADLVVVSIHGGVEYLLDPDPLLGPLAADLVAWGADLVWGHGPHVPQPVEVSQRAGRHSVVATSLGNLLFDQQRSVTQTGLLLEVLAGAGGVVAYRIGRASHPDLRPRFLGWDPPDGPAVLLDGEWWSLTVPVDPAPASIPELDGFPWGDAIAAGLGDVTGDGSTDLVVSYRHPFRPTEVNRLYPQQDFTDTSGRSAHLGVFEPSTFEPVWAAGTLLGPVHAVAVCDGSMSLAFDTLDDAEIVATGAWTWWDFGFAVAEELPGSGAPGCADIDGDGRPDPVVLDR